MHPRELLFSKGPPCVALLRMETAGFGNLQRQLAAGFPDAAIRRLRGRKCRTRPCFFDEIAAAMQFPGYFGENWAALHDMLLDLDWLPASAYLLMIDDADQLLAQESADHLRAFVELVQEANRQWLEPNRYIPRERQPTPFHVLVQAGVPAGDAARRRLEEAGADVVELAVPERDARGLFVLA